MWLTIDEKLHGEIDNRQALIDSAVYVAFSLLLATIFFLSYAAVRAFGVVLSPTFATFDWIALAIGSTVLGYAVYRLSLQAHAQFGEIWKSMFDTSRHKLMVKINDELSEWTIDEDI